VLVPQGLTVQLLHFAFIIAGISLRLPIPDSPRAEIGPGIPQWPTPLATCRAVPQGHAKPRPIVTRSNLRHSSYSSEVAYSSVSSMFYLRGD
jgi:hypothetical protein